VVVPPPVVATEPQAPAVSEADAGPPALGGESMQTWHLADARGNFDVVASVPVGAHGPRPLVVGIHGSKDRPEATCARWRKALAGWALVVCPAGVPYRGGLAWGAPSVMIERIDRAIAAAREHFGAFVADGPIAYAGWSLGATRGPSVVALRPGIFEPVVLAEVGHTRLDATASAKSLHAAKSEHAIVACATKRCAAFAKRLATAAAKSGPVVAFVDAGIGRGHLFDDRMAHTIGAAVATAVTADARWSGLAAALESPPQDDQSAALPEEEEEPE
jgi:hypothetical protein